MSDREREINSGMNVAESCNDGVAVIFYGNVRHPSLQARPAEAVRAVPASWQHVWVSTVEDDSAADNAGKISGPVHVDAYLGL